MPGYSIYSGPLRTEEQILSVFSNYHRIREITSNEETFTLAEDINDLRLRDDGVIQFTYSFERRIPYTRRRVTQFYVQTSDVNIKIIRRDELIFLIEHVKGVHLSDVISRLSSLLYSQGNVLLRVTIPSESIKAIESRDYQKISAEGFWNLTDRDSMVIAYGNLAIRHENGAEEFSDIHETYHNESKGYTRFRSISTGQEVFISSKKSSLSLRGAGADLDNVEQYINQNLLQRIVIPSRD